MASLLQIEANRRNSQRSTGPQTTEGKTRSSMNALRHGLYADTAVLSNENADAYNDLSQAFQDEYQPVGPAELHTLKEMVLASWKLLRFQNVELNLWELKRKLAIDKAEKLPGLKTWQVNAFAFSLDCHGRNEFTKLSLIEQRLQRSFYKSLDKLLQLQKLRRATDSDSEPQPVGQTLSSADPVNSDLGGASLPACEPVFQPACQSTDYDRTSLTISDSDTEPQPRGSGQDPIPPQSLTSEIGFVPPFRNSPSFVEAGHPLSAAPDGPNEPLIAKLSHASNGVDTTEVPLSSQSEPNMDELAVL